jgi:hypothetical protein
MKCCNEETGFEPLNNITDRGFNFFCFFNCLCQCWYSANNINKVGMQLPEKYKQLITVLLRNSLTLRSRSERVPNAVRTRSERGWNAVGTRLERVPEETWKRVPEETWKRVPHFG